MIVKFRILLVLCAVAAFAQNNSGRITGTVMDNSGAVIPAAAVVVTNQETGITWKAQSDQNGYYLVADLPVGAYSVEIIAGGFRKAKKEGFDLVDAGRITADFKLEIGTLTESVIVQEVLGETVNTVSGEVGHTIDSEQVRDLALNGRNYMQLASMIPGVALLDEDQMDLTTSLSTTKQSVNGTRGNTSNLMVDGGSNLDSGSNGSQINNVGVDFVREVSIQTSGMSAEYGRSSGAVINAVTKSGGNQFHGGVLYTIRNDVLDAKDYYAPQKQMLRFHDYGWNLGGPIAIGPLAKRKRLFFFGGQEWKSIRQFKDPTRRTLPTTAEIAGDFSDRKSTNIYYPGTKTPIPNKDLRPLMTKDGKAVMAVYGAMIKEASSFTDTPTSNNAIFQPYNPFNWRQDMARIDYNATDRHSIFFRWMHDHYDLVDPYGTFNSSQVPNTPTQRNRPGYGPQIGEHWTISPSLFNEAKLSASWNGQRTPLVGDAWKRSTYGFSFPLIYGGNGPYGKDGIPDVTVSSFASYNGPARVYIMSPTTDITFFDNLTYIRGNKTIKVGVMIDRNRKDQNGRTNYDGKVDFNTSPNNNTSNYALADVLLGNFSKYTEFNGDPVAFFRFTQVEGYIQNDWRINRSLTINLGMRYAHLTPTYTAANNVASFDPARYDPKQAVALTTQGVIVANSGNPYNGLVRAGDGIPADQVGRVSGANSPAINVVPAGAPRGFYNPYDLFMPRFGFAWAPFGSGKTAVRGAFGTFHDRIQGNVIFSQVNLPPYSTSAVYESGNLANPLAGTASAQAVLASINSIDPNLKVPAVYSYNFNIERSFSKGLFVRAGYVGNIQRHLLRQPDLNYPTFDKLAANYALSPRPSTDYIRPYKGFSAIRMFISDSNGNYNAMQLFASKRKGNFNVTASYTWQHALADTSGDTDNQDGGVGTENRRLYYGSPSFDRRQIFVATYTYRIPLFNRRKGFLGNAFGRWEISGVTRAQTGQHYTAVGSATGVTRRADYLGGEVALPSDERTPDKWFNTAAFKTAPNNRLGTAGVGSIVGPGLYVWDVSLRKEFRISEKTRMQFRADSFNLMNHVNFRSLNVTTSSADFGSFSGSGPARQIQGGLRLNF